MSIFAQQRVSSATRVRSTRSSARRSCLTLSSAAAPVCSLFLFRCYADFPSLSFPARLDVCAVESEAAAAAAALPVRPRLHHGCRLVALEFVRVRLRQPRWTRRGAKWSTHCAICLMHACPVQIWDLNFSPLDPVIQHETRKELTCVLFSPNAPVILVVRLLCCVVELH